MAYVERTRSTVPARSFALIVISYHFSSAMLLHLLGSKTKSDNDIILLLYIDL